MNFYIKDEALGNFTFNNVPIYLDTSGGKWPYFLIQNITGTNRLLGLYYRHSTAYPKFSSFTHELQLVRNNTVVETTGEYNATVISGVDYYSYVSSTSSNFKLTNTYFDLSIYTLRLIIRINGTIAKTFNFPMISLPGKSSSNGYTLGFSSPSSPQTGKVGTVSVQRHSTSTSFAKVYAVSSEVYAYKQSNNTFEYKTIGYVNNGLTPVNDNYLYNNYLTSFSCNYYVPYNSGITRSNNDSRFAIYLFPDISQLQAYYKTEQSSVWHSANRSDFCIVDSSIQMSYLNQTDSNAAPTIGSVSISESPAGISTTYGKYIGGGISTLTFAYSNVVYRYGSSFNEVIYKLYNSSSQLVNTWSSLTEATLAYTLENTDDTVYYLDVEIKSTILTTGTYRYSNIQSYGYSPPYVVSFNASRCDQDGTPNDTGAYCNITYQFKVIPLGDHNSKTVTLIAPDGSHVYTNLDYDHGSPYSYISEADIESSYNLTITIEDDFMTVSASRSLSTAGVIMDFLYNGKGIGLGKVSEYSEMVEVNPEWTFKCETMTFKGIDLQSILESLGYVFPS